MMLKATLLGVTLMGLQLCAVAILRQLTDADFESVTQAATGQTTGVWVIKFCSGSKKECRDLQPSWDRLAAEMLEQQVFLAEVDTDKNPKLAKRFSIHRHPTILLFRDRKMHVFPASAFADMFAGLRLFISSGYETALSTTVPPASASLLDHFHELGSHVGYLGAGIAVLSVVGILASLATAVAKPKKD